MRSRVLQVEFPLGVRPGFSIACSHTRTHISCKTQAREAHFTKQNTVRVAKAFEIYRTFTVIFLRESEFFFVLIN